MKLMESHERQIKIGRVSYWIYTDEYKTLWSISVKRVGRAMCVCDGWRYSKKHYPTQGAAINQVIDDLKKGGYL